LPDPNSKLLSPAEAGDRLGGIGYRRIRQLIATGELKATWNSTRHRWEITPAAVRACLKKRLAPGRNTKKPQS
jgi:hypothetical protein